MSQAIRVSQVDLELVVERFLVPILPRASFLAARDGYTETREQLPERPGMVLAPVVAVEDGRAAMVEKRVTERLYDDTCRMCDEHSNPDHLPTEQINGRRHDHVLAMVRQMREIRRPDAA